MKLIQLVNAKPALTALATTKLPAKVAYRIGKSINLINSEFTSLEDARVNLLNSLGTPNTKTNQYEFEDGGVAFQAAMAEIQNEEIILALPKFTLDELGPVNIEPVHLATLADIGMLVDEIRMTDG